VCDVFPDYVLQNV